MNKVIKKAINFFLAIFRLKLIRVKFNTKQKPIENVIPAPFKTQFQILNGNVIPPFNYVPFAGETLQFLINNFQFETVLDIGSGEGKHSDVFKKFDKIVTSIDYGRSVYFNTRSDGHTCVIGDYYTYKFNNTFDAIWASHVLEHQPNPNLFLKKVHNDLKEGGILAITVPPLKHEIVGGHVTLWNAGLLMYHLVLAGFNCQNISIKTYGYNISVILKKDTIKYLPDLDYDKGDILKLKEYFPEFVNEPFNGMIDMFNWCKNK